MFRNVLVESRHLSSSTDIDYHNDNIKTTATVKLMIIIDKSAYSEHYINDAKIYSHVINITLLFYQSYPFGQPPCII